MQIRQMKLTEYVSINTSNNTGAVSQLIKEFNEGLPPSQLGFPSGQYASTAYKEKLKLAPLATIFASLTQRAFQPIYLTNLNYDYLKNMFGYSPDSKENAMKCYLFGRAATYKFAHVGDCSFRASYGALLLADIFSNSDIKVTLISVTSKDQYVVMLGNNKKAWFIYDPLINPELVFEFDFYKSEILSLFRHSESKAQPFKLVITKQLLDEFNLRWPSIKSELINLLKNSQSSVDILLQDPVFVGSLERSGVPKNQWTSMIEEAIKLSDDLLNKKIESKSNNETLGQYGTLYRNTKTILEDNDKLYLDILRNQVKRLS